MSLFRIFVVKSPPKFSILTFWRCFWWTDRLVDGQIGGHPISTVFYLLYQVCSTGSSTVLTTCLLVAGRYGTGVLEAYQVQVPAGTWYVPVRTW
jgi:hypothetical protein